MEAFNERNEILLGAEGLSRLAQSRVALFGLGGVGGACGLDLVRAGVGTLYILDYDVVAASNLNRLAYGFGWNVGVSKPTAFSEAALSINPRLHLQTIPHMLGQNADFDALPEVDFYIDAIDTLNAKVCALEWLIRKNKPFISATGAGGRIRPDLLTYGRLEDVHGDPLAREVRNRLRRRGVQLTIPVVWSREPPRAPAPFTEAELAAHAERRAAYAAKPEGTPPGRPRRRQGTLPFVPQAAGHLLASYTVQALLGTPIEV